jgi:hypothetical protein
MYARQGSEMRPLCAIAENLAPQVTNEYRRKVHDQSYHVATTLTTQKGTEKAKNAHEMNQTLCSIPSQSKYSNIGDT